MIISKKKINLDNEQNQYLIRCFKLYSNNHEKLCQTYFDKYPGIKVSYSTLHKRYLELLKSTRYFLDHFNGINANFVEFFEISFLLFFSVKSFYNSLEDFEFEDMLIKNESPPCK